MSLLLIFTCITYQVQENPMAHVAIFLVPLFHVSKPHVACWIEEKTHILVLTLGVHIHNLTLLCFIVSWILSSSLLRMTEVRNCHTDWKLAEHKELQHYMHTNVHIHTHLTHTHTYTTHTHIHPNTHRYTTHTKQTNTHDTLTHMQIHKRHLAICIHPVAN